MLNPTPTTIYLKDYRPPAFLISSVDLDVDIQDDLTRVTASLAVRRNPKGGDPKAPLVLMGDEVDLESIAVDGKPLPTSAYSLEAGELTVPAVPDQFTLMTVCRIYPKRNTKLMGLYTSKDGYFTQCEAEGFRRITYFIDRPDVMARYTTTIHAEKAKYPMLLSNGNLVASGDEAPSSVEGSTRPHPTLSQGERDLTSARHWARWEDPFPKPSYLFALVAAKLDKLEDTYTTQSGRKVSLQIYVEPGRLDQSDFAMLALKKSMR